MTIGTSFTLTYQHMGRYNPIYDYITYNILGYRNLDPWYTPVSVFVVDMHALPALSVYISMKIVSRKA